MTSINMRKDPNFIRGGLPCEGEFEIPIIHREELPQGPIDLVACSRTRPNDAEENRRKGVHFFVDDYRFRGLRYDVTRNLEKYGQYAFLLSPDFSRYCEMPTWQVIDAVGMNRWTDWFTDELFGGEMDGVTVVKAKLSRFECDAERLEGESDRLCRFICESDKSDDRREWVLRNAQRRNMYLAEWYRYRAEILDVASDDLTLIVDCHSFPSDLAPDVDVCIGFNEDTSKPDPRTLDLVAQTLRDSGYSVAFNRPYSNALAPVGYIGHSLMIEVSKRTYMDEVTLQKGGGFEHLKNTIESVYRELLWTRLNKPRCFGCPRGYPNDGTAEERSAAWEKIKESIVRYTAERYGLAMPEDMSDTDGIRKLRRILDGNWGAPSWTHARSWLMLANAMLREVFGRVGVTLPDDAFVQHYMHHSDMPKTWQAHFRSAI